MKYNNFKTSTIPFRYSVRFWYFSIWFGMWIVIGLGIIYFFRIYYYTPSEPHGRVLTALELLVFIVCVAIIPPLLGLWISLRITDKKAIANFNNHEVTIIQKHRTINLAYDEIKHVKFITIYTSSKGTIFTSDGAKFYKINEAKSRGPFGPFCYQIIIKDLNNKKYKIQGSYKESWEVRKLNANHSLYSLSCEFSKHGIYTAYSSTVL